MTTSEQAAMRLAGRLYWYTFNSPTEKTELCRRRFWEQHFEEGGHL